MKQRPRAKQSRKLLETGKGKGITFPLQPPRINTGQRMPGFWPSETHFRILTSKLQDNKLAQI